MIHTLSMVIIGYRLINLFWQYQIMKKEHEYSVEKSQNIIIKSLSDILFLILFFNFPLIAIWQYMRRNDFFAPEALEYESTYDYMGLEFLIIYVFILFVLPLLFYFSKDKINKAVSIFILFISLIITFSGFWQKPQTTFPVIFLMSITALYAVSIFSEIKYLMLFKEEEKIKRLWLRRTTGFSFLSNYFLIILILAPNFGLEHLTENILRKTKSGGMEVSIKNHLQQEQSGHLLLKTKDFYYLRQDHENKKDHKKITIIQTANTELFYEVPSR